MDQLLKIKQTAKDVRRWAEYLHKKLPVWKEGLGGMCAICSYEIFIRLRRLGLRPYIVLGRGHCWVICNKCLIDVTATQFFSKKDLGEKRYTALRRKGHIRNVYVIPQEDANLDFWMNGRKRKIKTIKEARKVFRKWEAPYNPFDIPVISRLSDVLFYGLNKTN